MELCHPLSQCYATDCLVSKSGPLRISVTNPLLPLNGSNIDPAKVGLHLELYNLVCILRDYCSLFFSLRQCYFS